MTQEERKHFKTIAYAASTGWLAALLKVAEAEGYSVKRCETTQTVTAEQDGKVLLRAMQIGGKRWMVRGDDRVFSPAE